MRVWHLSSFVCCISPNRVRDKRHRSVERRRRDQRGNWGFDEMRNRHRETEKGTQYLQSRILDANFWQSFFRNHRNTDIEIQKYNICGIIWQKEMKIQKYKNTKLQNNKMQKYKSTQCRIQSYKIKQQQKSKIRRKYNAETPLLFMSVELQHLHSLIGLVWLWPFLASPTPYPILFFNL